MCCMLVDHSRWFIEAVAFFTSEVCADDLKKNMGRDSKRLNRTSRFIPSPMSTNKVKSRLQHQRKWLEQDDPTFRHFGFQRTHIGSTSPLKGCLHRSATNIALLPSHLVFQACLCHLLSCVFFYVLFLPFPMRGSLCTFGSAFSSHIFQYHVQQCCPHDPANVRPPAHSNHAWPSQKVMLPAQLSTKTHDHIMYLSHSLSLSLSLSLSPSRPWISSNITSLSGYVLNYLLATFAEHFTLPVTPSFWLWHPHCVFAPRSASERVECRTWCATFRCPPGPC